MNILAQAENGQPAEEVDYGRLVMRHTRDAIVVTGIDGRIVWTNPAFERLTGFFLAEVVGRKPGEFLQGPRTDAATVRHIAHRLAERAPVKAELVNYTKSGRPYWIELDIAPVFDEDGHHTAFIAVERDVTERKEMYLEMERTRIADARRRDERRVLAEMGEWLYSADTLEELRFIVSEALPRLVPSGEGTLFVYRHSRDRLEPVAGFGGGRVKGDLLPKDCWALRRGRSHTYGGQLLNLACEHSVSTEMASVCVPLLAHGETIGLLAVSFADMDAAGSLDDEALAEFEERRQLVSTSAKQIGLAIANVRLKAELRAQSTRDVLTGLPNRRWFMEEFRGAVVEAGASGGSVAVVSLDIDSFKAVNDTYGHSIGDAVLKAVAAIMNDVVGSLGAACRFGGEEFVVLLPGVEAPRGAELAEALRARIAAGTGAESTAIPAVTVSAGVATFPAHGPTGEAVLERADEALYEAKRQGRDRVVVA